MKARWKQIQAAVLIAVMISIDVAGAFTAYGAEAAVEVDETMYVNLDYYGKISMANVVKGCSLNGSTSFTDYGTYEDVTNMSTLEQPVLENGSVTWNLPDDQKGRFYFKGKIKTDQVVLPWTFDVSYKLNGVPVNGDKLAGASGMVEINVKADPNDSAKEYYRNNMMLIVAVPVDLTDSHGIEAEGAQIQNLGETTAAVFTALPGEEGDYTVRIGTDSFETTGVIMTMMPGTMEDLEHIKDLKEAKETWKDAGDGLYDSMEQMMLSMEAMREGVNQTRKGLDSADQARETWSGSKDDILTGNDQALAALGSVSEQMEVMIPHIQSARDSAEVVNESMGDIVNTLGDMQDPMRKLEGRLRSVKEDAGSLAGDIPQMTELIKAIIQLDATLQASEQAYVTGLGQLAGSIDQASDDYYEDDVDLTNDLNQGGSAEDSDEQRLASSSNIPATIPGVTMDTQQLLQSLTAKKAYLETVSKASSELSSRLSSLMDKTGDSAGYTSEMLDSMDYLIEDMTAMHDSLDSYYPDLQAALDDTEELVDRTVSALNESLSTMTVLQNTLKASSDNFDAAARESVRGTMKLLDKSLSVLDSTAGMRKAGRTMKDTIDDEWKEFDEDNNFLLMDPSAERVSFTSDENEAPHTLQIVLRTDEISLDDEDNSIQDGETEKAAVSPLRRMWNVLVKMWKAAVEIFKNR